MYGSSFCIVTDRPRHLSNRPRDEAVRPFPRLDATPPVTKMCLAKALCLLVHLGFRPLPEVCRDAALPQILGGARVTLSNLPCPSDSFGGWTLRQGASTGRPEPAHFWNPPSRFSTFS